MNRKDIETMAAGPEMDALVAERVIGCNYWDFVGDYDGPYPMYTDFVPHGVCIYQDKQGGPGSGWFKPSTRIAAALMVVEKLCIPAPEDCWTSPTIDISYQYGDAEVYFDYLDVLDGIHPNYNGHHHTRGKAETIELAICRAALFAVMEFDE